MGQLAEVLYPLPDRRRTALSSLAWWESKRITYNKAVGGAGLFTLTSVAFFFTLPPFPEPPPLAFLAGGAVVWGIAANVCYSLGWIVEQTARKLWGRQTPDMGPLMFREGLIFSVGLTLLPSAFAAVAWVARVAQAIF
ncbi:MAG TPA: hypothetical protein VF006_24675 [Longimicrobium sp.]